MKKLLILIVMLNFALIASNNTTSKISIDKTNTIYASQVKKEQGKSKFMANVLENWKNKYEILSLKNENLLAIIEDEEEKLSYLKWVYGFLLAVAGFLGYREYSKFVNIRKEMKKEIAEVKKLKNEIINIKEENTKTLKRITLFNKATSEFNSGKIEKAIYTLEKIKEENPDDYESTWFLARCYIGLGGNYYDKAINVAKEALSLVEEPQETYHAYNQIASAYLGMENYSKALEVYKEHLDSVQIAEIKNSYAYCYFRAKKNKEAYLKFQEAKKTKANISSCLGIAKTKLIYGKYEDSCTYAKRTIEDGSREEKMDLASIWTYYNLAFAYLILNKNECLDYINKANKKTTNKAQIRAQIIDCNLVLGNASIDQELLEKCITLWKKSLANESI